MEKEVDTQSNEFEVDKCSESNVALPPAGWVEIGSVLIELTFEELFGKSEEDKTPLDGLS